MNVSGSVVDSSSSTATVTLTGRKRAAMEAARALVDGSRSDEEDEADEITQPADDASFELAASAGDAQEDVEPLHEAAAVVIRKRGRPLGSGKNQKAAAAAAGEGEPTVVVASKPKAKRTARAKKVRVLVDDAEEVDTSMLAATTTIEAAVVEEEEEKKKRKSPRKRISDSVVMQMRSIKETRVSKTCLLSILRETNNQNGSKDEPARLMMFSQSAIKMICQALAADLQRTMHDCCLEAMGLTHHVTLLPRHVKFALGFVPRANTSAFDPNRMPELMQ